MPVQARRPATAGVGMVAISSSDPPLRVVAHLSDSPPVFEAGFGGWDEVARPRRSPITTWKALPGLRLTLPILIDQWATGVSIERQIEALQQMGRPTASDGEPPQVRITSTGGAVPGQARTWVIDGLSFGDSLMNALGNRVRQQVTVSLLEFVEDIYLAQRSVANQQRAKAQVGRQKPGAARKRVSVSSSRGPGGTLHRAGRSSSLTGHGWGSGETLVRIAARELGDADRWVEIAELNDLRDPRAVPFGMVIRLP